MEITILTVAIVVAVYLVSCFFRGAKSTTPFAPGDKVTAFGNTGTVKRISPNGLYVEVMFPEFDSIVTFHPDGKQSKWHKAPSLRKV
jgi:hypothetical protein